MANEIVTELILDLDKWKSKLKEAEGLGEKGGKAAGDGFGESFEKGIGSVFGGLGAKLVAIGATIAGALTFKEIIGEATEAQDALNRFNSALSVTGNLSPETSRRFTEFAAGLQKITTVSDDLIVSNAALLVSVGKLSGDGLEKATKAALDLAAGLQIDTSSAFEIVSKAASGHVGVLNRYGLKLRETGDAQADFDRALQKINSTFGGLAESKVNTFSGALAQLTNNFKDVLETIGTMVIKSPVLIALIKFLSSEFVRLNQSVEAFAGANNDPFGQLIKSGIGLAKVIIETVGPPVELLFNLLQTGTLTILTGLSAIVQGLSVVGQAMIDFLRQPILDVLGGFGKIISVFDKDLGDSLVNFGSKAIDATQNTLAEINAITEQTTNALFTNTANAANSAFTNFDATQAGIDLSDKLLFVAETAKPAAEAIATNIRTPFEQQLPRTWDFIVNGFNYAFGKTRAASEQFARELQTRLNGAFDAFKVGVAQSFASIGSALVKGENAFDAFKKAIIGVFGDLAIQLGTFFFLLGLAEIFFNPAAAAAQIAGGLALIVLGGALKALAGGAGGGGASFSGGGGGGGGAGGGGVALADNGPTNNQFAQNEQKPQTNINVNIAGNVLDRRQTGLEIAEVINETFGSNGITVANA